MSHILGIKTHDMFSVKIRSAALTVAATPTLIKSGTTVLSLRKGFIFCNFSTSLMYLGDSSVSSTSGMPVFPYETVTIGASDICNWYAVLGAEDVKIAGAPTNEARVIEGY